MDSTNHDFTELNIAIRDSSIANILDDEIKKLDLELSSKSRSKDTFFDNVHYLYSQTNKINNASLKEYYTKLVDSIKSYYIEILR